MPLSSRPPAEAIDTVTSMEESGIRLNTDDEAFLEKIRAMNGEQSTRVLDNISHAENPDSLYKYLLQIERSGGPGVLTTLTRDSEWQLLYQKARWADIASRVKNRIALLRKQLHHEKHSGKFNGKKHRMMVIEATIDRLSN